MSVSEPSFARKVDARPRVLVALRLFETASQHKLAGIFAYLDTHASWDIQLLRTQEELSVDALDEAERNGLDGLIVSTAYSPALFRRIADLRCPIVIMDQEPEEIRRRTKDAMVIRNDADDIVRTALRAFSSAGRFNSFAYVSSRAEMDWSTLRARAFRAQTDGKAAVLGPTGTESDRPQIVRFLRQLRLPAAVLAAHDTRAADVIAAAAAAGIDVPGDLSVLGVDNDPYVCNRTDPPIASLEPDFFSEGKAAAKLLAKMMRSRTPTQKRHVTIGVKRLIPRGSLVNLPPAQHLLVRAREYIRIHATEGIGPQDVAAHLRISRQLLDLRFHEARKGTVGQLITETRLTEVKRLLARTDTPIGQIADVCGFSNANALKNLFRRTTGMSMLKWRQQAR